MVHSADNRSASPPCSTRVPLHMASMQLDPAAVAATCSQAQSELAAAFSRGLDRTVRVAVGQPGRWSDFSSKCTGAGLLLVLGSQQAVLCLLCDSSGFVPRWSVAPDATSRSRLATLAQELLLLALPEGAVDESFAAGHVSDLHVALQRAAVTEAASVLPLQLTDDAGTNAVLYLVWPAQKPEMALQEPIPSQTETTAAASPAVTNQAQPAQAAASTPRSRPKSVAELPPYTQSLLRIKVPVVVTLASRKQPVARILDLGPGSILQFDKSCEDLLDIEVGGRCIARGEAVKVGDKFGIRIANFSPTGERFHTVRRNDKDRT